MCSLGDGGMIRVIIADDHHIVRQGLRALLERDKRIEVVGEAADGQEAVELAQKLQPDIVILDIAMPRLDGVQATSKIMALDTKTQVIVLSVHNRRKIAQRVLRNGAAGYLLKNAVNEELILAILAARRGEIYLSPEISKSILNNLWSLEQETGSDDLSLQLTAREHEVLKLIVDGYTNNEIGEMLHISPKTVSKHRMNLMTKLGVNDVTGLMRVALKEGLVFLDE
ncbi:MAG: response regulator transcription factor [Anaerolineae bacterium]|nr:response regulator transcription factor [Anaerolineae bacterium]